MKTTTERLNDKSKEVFMELYYSGMSVDDIQTLADNLVKIGEGVIENLENTISAISNGRLEID